MKKLISLTAAAGLLLASAPALAVQPDRDMMKSMHITNKMQNKMDTMQNKMNMMEKKVQTKMLKVIRKSPRLLQEKKDSSKKLTPSEACKTVWGKERAACMKAFNKAGKPQTGWTWSSSSSSSSMSSSSMSSSSSSMSSASSASSN